MNPVFDRFVANIVRQTDCNVEEREELYDELMSHLECAYSEERENGASEEEAVQIAMKKFGSEQEVGKQIQQAMYPYRRLMMIILSIASLLYVYGVYAAQLFMEGDAHIPWLVSGVVISTALLLVTLRPISRMNRRLWMNGLLLIHLIVFLYGLLIIPGVNPPYSLIFGIMAVLILLLSAVLVYRTTIYDFPSPRQPNQKDAKRVHYINISTGFLIVFVSLFFLWAFLLFAGNSSSFLFILLIPTAVWIISYSAQMGLLARGKRSAAYTVTTLQTVVIIALACFWVFVVV
ncbi:hypothetical protein NCCP2222_23550 [Sporosarcina sp. NCCP-2222]|uniref:permease prefix domain 1-containing protein n=1 Tax=Sporosarcina sp. NCCP-2222 TaxID=2935073 RepID=UPI002088D08E|nr:permease prefix domain 1-containing protein [Sporosarcina sp. NCCP-2222]GKV56408.1 hypothetical protein NCCP2222_23550 [Sporosarcina sp. NCCP-2222]